MIQPETITNQLIGEMISLSFILEAITIKYNTKIDDIKLFFEENRLIEWIENPADIDTTVEMNFELCEALAQSDTNFEHISIVFRAFQNS